MRTCRVVPDVPAIGREFDYRIPEELADRVEIGSVVRVPLHGRRVRGWVVELDGQPQATTLLAVARVSSVGPDRDTIELCRWAAWRWAGPLSTFLRAATPAANVAARPARRAGPAAPAPAPPDEHVAALAAGATSVPRAVVRWPPLRDRRPLVRALLPIEGSAIVVTADTARAAAVVRWLRSQEVVAVLDVGDLSARARADAWRSAAAGACVVVGGRVAAFAPVPDLALGIVVEDGDEALQEERAPTWHARDLLAERCRRAGVPWIVVAAAPTVEAVVAADRVLALPAAAERAGWPPVEVVDRREEPPGAGLLGPHVTRALQAELDAGRLAVCVVNRRGRVRLAACATCGQLVRLDEHGRAEWAPSPGSPTGDPLVCPSCGTARFRQVRAGVARLREELAALLPRARVVDVDRDTDDVDGADVLIGTEAVLYRADVRHRQPGLVAFLDFDQELLAPRMRAAEQALRLVVRAARLLDRRPPGQRRVLLQTRHADHEVVRAARHGEPEIVVSAELERRRSLGLPPFAALAELRGDPPTVARAVAAAVAVAPAGTSLDVLGPRHEGDTDVVLIRAPGSEALSAALAAARAARGDGRLRIAVDPPRV